MAVMFLFLLFAFSGVIQCQPFLATISTADNHELGKDVPCKVTITNVHNTGYYLLRRNTPLDVLNSDIFSVTKDGEVVQYDGLLYQRVAPTLDEFVFVPAKASIDSVVDLSRSYPFAKETGYTVKLDTTFIYFKYSISNTSTLQVSSNPKTFNMVGNEDDNHLTEAEVLRKNASSINTLILSQFGQVGSYKTPAFAGTPRGNDISSTLNVYAASYNILPTSYTAVSGNPTLYTTWFGVRYSGYMNTVKGAYINIKSAIEAYQFTLYFDGPECVKIANVIAYTYKRSTVIYLCSIYRSEPDIKGVGTKLGTIVHELTHAVAYTDDITYGQTNCQSLARNNPNEAVKNADNYHYFSEQLAQ